MKTVLNFKKDDVALSVPTSAIVAPRAWLGGFGVRQWGAPTKDMEEGGRGVPDATSGIGVANSWHCGVGAPQSEMF